ncbi:transposase domain-containing protein [Streptomyces cadmiisoli]|uniref:transposase domain-containing protein n=1 Tax=Streptomyces cadmiisoli TaxID=2184053 RepID=UPI003669D386
MGELTQIVPFEMVDAALAECGALQQRLRKSPARVVVYLLLAAALFEECGYPAVWRKLTGALGSLPLPAVTATGLWHARCRLGVRPTMSRSSSGVGGFFPVRGSRPRRRTSRFVV